MTKKLFELMDINGVSAYRLAKDIGVSTGNVADWKSGRATPKFEALLKIADYFGVTTDYLLGRQQTEIQALFDMGNESQQNEILKFSRIIVGAKAESDSDKGVG